MNIYFAALILTSALNLFAVWRMLLYRVQKKLSFLVAFLLFQLAQSITLLSFTRSMQSKAYQEIYEVTEPLNWILYILIVREMYGQAFAEFPGISSLARWTSYASAALAVFLCIGLALVSPGRNWPEKQIFGFIEVWEKFVAFALAAFIVLMVFLVSKYPIKLDFNVASSIAVFAVYFLGSFASLQIGAAGNFAAVQFQTAGLLTISSVCFAAWGIFLKRSSGVSRVQVRTHSKPFEEQRLLDQLTFINSMLVKSARE